MSSSAIPSAVSTSPRPTRPSTKKVLKVLAEGLKPIVCVGESLQQKQTNITNEVVCMQTKAALCGVSPAKVTDVVIAYERSGPLAPA